MEVVVEIVLLGSLACTAIAIAKMKDLFASVMLTGIYSLLSAALFVVMHAVDVAFTEASVGAGISTILMLSTLTLTGQFENPQRQQPQAALAVVTITGILLIYGTLDMPDFGSADAPINLHVNPYYIEKSMADTGIPNIVTSVLASYRGYDTLGETVVIFTAGLAVLSLLSFSPSRAQRFTNKAAPMKHHTILRIISKILIPPILIFALYVQFHGDYGPGGGFQAGVIFSAAIILYTMIYGLDTARRVIHSPLVQMLSAVGVLLYGSVGLVCMLSGKNFLDYSGLSHEPVHGQHLGILLVEAGVGITVTSVMTIIFFTFSGRVDKH